MSLDIGFITFDCGDAPALAAFWSAALDRPLDPAMPEAGDFFASIGFAAAAEGKPGMMFIKVPEGKSAKNRMHLDLRAGDREAEVARLVGLGATIIHEKEEFGTNWTTLADPEGNEFCVANA